MGHSLFHKTLKLFREEGVEGTRILAGISGGMDSTVLLHLLSRLAGPQKLVVQAAHIHHGPAAHEPAHKESVLEYRDRARRMALEFCASLSIPCFSPPPPAAAAPAPAPSPSPPRRGHPEAGPSETRFGQARSEQDKQPPFGLRLNELKLNEPQLFGTRLSGPRPSGSPLPPGRAPLSSRKPLAGEAALRDFRHSRLDSLRREKRAQWTALAHHSEDLLETRLIRLIRGCGETGLAAMKPLDPPLLRPFLSVMREEIKDYALSYKLSWAEDPGNQDKRFLRNWLRNQWLPDLEKKRPGGVRRLAASLSHIAAAAGEAASSSFAAPSSSAEGKPPPAAGERRLGEQQPKKPQPAPLRTASRRTGSPVAGFRPAASQQPEKGRKLAARGPTGRKPADHIAANRLARCSLTESRSPAGFAGWIDSRRGIDRRLLMEGAVSDRRRALAFYMRQKGLKNYGTAHIDELLKRLGQKRKNFRLRLLKKEWRAEGPWLFIDG